MSPNHKSPQQSSNDASIFAALPIRVVDCDSSLCPSPARDSATPVLLIPASLSQSPSPAPFDSPPERIPRPPNSFMLFRSDFLKREVIPASVEKRQQTLSRVAGEVWNLMPPEEKKQWHEKSAEALRLHNLRHPNYKFSPVRRGSAQNKAAKEGSTSKERIRELRETYLHMPGPAVPATRRKKGKQPGSTSKAKDEMAIGSASESTDIPTRSRSMERTLPEEAPLPMTFPRPSCPHLLADSSQIL